MSSGLSQRFLNHAARVSENGFISLYMFEICRAIAEDPLKLPELSELQALFAINDLDNPELAENEQFLQVIQSSLVQELQLRWTSLGMLLKYPIDVVKAISSAERLSRNEIEAKDRPEKNNDALVYGEVDANSFADIFVNYLHLAPGGCFVDLGSGTGRAVFAAALYHDFDSCVGVELLCSLYDISQKQLEEYRNKNALFHKRLAAVATPSVSSGSARGTARPVMARPGERKIIIVDGLGDSKKPAIPVKKYGLPASAAFNPQPARCTSFQPHSLDRLAKSVEFTLGDLREFEWSNATVVFCAATCFDGPLLQHIADRSAHLVSGAYLISLSEVLRGPHLVLRHTVVYRMSWGRATVYIQQRI